MSEQHGIDTYLHFIRRLLVHSHSRLSVVPTPTTYDPSTALTFRLLVQETQRLARDPFLADRFRDGVDKGEGETFRSFDLQRFVDRVNLRPLERLVLASSIASGSTRADLHRQGVQIVRTEFEAAALALCGPLPSFEQADLSPNQIAKLLSNLLCEPQDPPILDSMQRQALIAAAQNKYGSEIVAPIVQRLVPSLRYAFFSMRRSSACAYECVVSSLLPDATIGQSLADLGLDMSNDPEVVLAMLARFGVSATSPPTNEQVVDVVQGLALMAAEGRMLPDVGTLIRVLASFVSGRLFLLYAHD